MRIHDKQEVEVIKTKIPSVTRDKLLSAISAQPATIVDVLKINQLGELCWPLEPKGEKEPANKEELDQMLNAMERLKSTRINASLKVEQPFVSSQQASGQERLLQTETVRIPLSLKIEDLATKDVATAAEMLKLDQIP